MINRITRTLSFRQATQTMVAAAGLGVMATLVQVGLEGLPGSVTLAGPEAWAERWPETGPATAFLHRLGVNLAQTLGLGLALVAIVDTMVTRPLLRIARELAGVNPLTVGVTTIAIPPGHEADELGTLVARFNLLLGTMAVKDRDRGRQQEALAKSEERLRLAITATRSGIWDINLETNEYWWSPEFAAALGYAPDDLVPDPATWRALVHPDDLAGVLRRWTVRAQGSSRTFRMVYRMRGKSGAWMWVKDRVLIIRGADGRPRRYTGIMRDITAQKLAEDQLKHLATHDQLTNLPNRTLIQDRLERSLTATSGTGGKVAVLFLDIDRFKLINESIGHEAGDAVLRAVAERLPAAIGAANTLGRLNGDAFVAVLAGVQEPDIARCAQAMLAAMRDPFAVEDRSLQLAASIGISVFPDDAGDVATLMKHADAAVNQAKVQAGNSYQFYTAEMQDHALARLALEQDLHEAIGRSELELWYQPKVCVGSLKIIGFEALIRWPRAGGGYVPPSEFIPVAEETGLIVPIGDWVIETACRQLVLWRDSGRRPVPIAVNVSARQLKTRAVVARIAEHLAHYRLPPELLQIEITESVLLDDVDTTVAILHEIRDLGVGISIDDFGTGYSSLAYLRRLPIGTLKIDRAFIRNLPGDAEDATMTAAIIGLGRQLGLRLVAEGVETPEQLAFLRDAGCDEMQGFLFSPARPADDFAGLSHYARWLPANGSPTNGAPANSTAASVPWAATG